MSPNITPSQTEVLVSDATKNSASIPVQRTAEHGQTTPLPTFGFGVVRGCGDSTMGGQLLILADIFGPKPVPCSYVSPVGGGGAGFFALPGIGATVLCANIPSTNPPVSNIWMGCLYQNGQVTPESFISQPYLEVDVEAARFYTPERPASMGVDLGCGVPSQEVIYTDNNLPNSYVFQHPAGHMLRMTKKVTSQRNQNEIVLRSAMGKRLVLNDSPAKFGGNSLQLLDGDNNGISIYTQSTAPTIALETGGNITQTTREGDITSTIPVTAKDASIELINASINSHIGVSSIGVNGTLNLIASSEINLRVGDTSLMLNAEGLTIKAAKVVIEGGEDSDVTLGGVSVADHAHAVTVNIPTVGMPVASTGTGVGATTTVPSIAVATVVTTAGTITSPGIVTQSITTPPLTALGVSIPLPGLTPM
tara:strand:- start:21254 stop:22516 length:1263 start_codon:yes stop_codon:yes gene_type:complete